MAKINFQQFKVAQNIAHTQFTTADLREGIANHLYKERGGIASLDLAMKIYKSEGEADYDEKELALISDIIEHSNYNCAVLHAFNEVLAAQEQKDE